MSSDFFNHSFRYTSNLEAIFFKSLNHDIGRSCSNPQIYKNSINLRVHKVRSFLKFEKSIVKKNYKMTQYFNERFSLFVNAGENKGAFSLFRDYWSLKDVKHARLCSSSQLLIHPTKTAHAISVAGGNELFFYLTGVNRVMDYVSLTSLFPQLKINQLKDQNSTQTQYPNTT